MPVDTNGAKTAMRAALTEVGLLPHVTPRMAHPKVMGWLCGFVDALLDAGDVEPKQTRSLRAQLYIGVFGEDTRGQMVAIDAVTEHEALREGRDRGSYAEPMLQAIPVGRADAEAWARGEPVTGLAGLLAS